MRKKKYTKDEEVISDLTKIIRFVESKMDFIVKAYDVHAKRYILEHKTKAGMSDVLKTMLLWKDGKK